MVKRLIEIPTNDAKIYKQILAIMNFIFDATEQERSVVSELIKLNNEYEALEEKKRAKFILSTDMRKEMRKNLDINEKQFNILISRLKKKKLFNETFISKDGVLNPNLLFKADEEGYEILIRLKKRKEQKKKAEKPSKKETKPVENKSSDKEASITKEEKIPKMANNEEVVNNIHEGNIEIL